MNIKDNIEPEYDINNIAPRLASLPKLSPFSVPENYFENLSVKITEKCVSAEDVKFVAPVQVNIEKMNPYSVPVNYFEELPYIIVERCTKTQTESKLATLIAYIQNHKLSLTLVAAAVAMFIAVKFAPTDSPIRERVGATITAEDISNSNYLLDIDEAFIIEQLEEQDDLEKKNKSSEIENYLIENNVDVSTIINEL